jgi:hypothetical protein
VTSLRAAALPSEKRGVDRACGSGLESGRRNPTIVPPWHIANTLGVKLRLFFDDGQPAPPLWFGGSSAADWKKDA